MENEKELLDIGKKVTEETDSSLFLVDFQLKGNPGKAKLMYFVDGDEGASIDQCAAISRQIGKIIEEENLIENQYVIEVSTPGVDRPLKLIRQYPKNQGRELQVTLNSGEVLEGVLRSVDTENNRLILDRKVKKEKVAVDLLLDDIKETKVKISFR